jgi:hypothetical protein
MHLQDFQKKAMELTEGNKRLQSKCRSMGFQVSARDAALKEVQSKIELTDFIHEQANENLKRIEELKETHARCGKEVSRKHQLAESWKQKSEALTKVRL